MSKAIDEMTSKELDACAALATAAVRSNDYDALPRFENRYRGSLSGWIDALAAEYEDRNKTTAATRMDKLFAELTT